MTSKKIHKLTPNHSMVLGTFTIKHHIKTHFDDEPIEMEFFNVRRTEECLVGHQCLNRRDRSFLFGISDYWEGPYEMPPFLSRKKTKERKKP